MARGRILFIRSYPSDLNFATYNNQQMGMGRAFCSQGYDFEFYTFNSAREREVVFFERNGCTAKYVEVNRKKLLIWGINVSMLRREFLDRYDLIICQEYYQIMTYLVAGRTSKAVLYAGPYWNMFLPKIVSPVYDLLATKRLEGSLRVKFAKSTLMKSFLEGKGYTNVVELGVALDTERFEDHVDPDEKAVELVAFMERNPCILYVGRIDRNKNTGFLLSVFKKLHRKNPALRLVIIGRDATPLVMRLQGKVYYETLLESLTEEERECILHIESIENSMLRFVYPLAQCLVLPSKLEVFGMVLLEAMFFGVPVVTSINGGSSSLIKSEDYGTVMDGFDETEWSEAICRYVDDRDLARRVGANTMQLIRERFTWDKLVPKMIEECEKSGVLTNKRSTK